MAITKNFFGLDVLFGAVPPTSSTLAREPGSVYYVTSDGTADGAITEQWTYTQTGWVKTNVATAAETLTTLSLSTNILSYVDENGDTTNIDLSLYLDDTNLARLVSGTLDSVTGIATFTRDDSTTFTVDLSALNIKRLQDLTDVTITSAASGQVLSWNGSAWVNSTPAEGVTTLAELTDVDVVTKVDGDVLTWNGTDWVAEAPAAVPSALDDLTDVVITSATSGQALTFNGTNWVNTTLVGGGSGVTELDQLLDVDVTLNEDGSVLMWSDADSKWVPARVPWTEVVVPPAPPSTDIFTNIAVIPASLDTIQQQTVFQSGSAYSNKAFVLRTGNTYQNRWFTKDFVTFTQPWVAFGGNVPDAYTGCTYVNGTYILYDPGSSINSSTTPYYASSDGLNWVQVSVTGITGSFVYSYLKTFGTDLWGCNFAGNFVWTTDGVTWNKEAYTGSTSTYNAYTFATFKTDNGLYAISKSDTALIDIFDTTVYPPAFVRSKSVANLVSVAAVGDNFYYGQNNGANTDVYKSSDYGVTWTKIGSAARSNVYKVSVVKNRIYFYGNGAGVVVTDTVTDTVSLAHPANWVEFVGMNSAGKIVIVEAITNTDGTYWDLSTADIYGETYYKQFIIDDMVNVEITEKENGEVLTWSSDVQKWVNAAIPDPLGVDTLSDVITSAGAISFSGNAVNTGIIIPTGALTSLEWTGITTTSSAVTTSKVTTIIKQGATAYLPTSYKINGSTVTVKWLGGTAPSAGTVNGINVITLNIIRTGNAYTVFGSMTSYS